MKLTKTYGECYPNRKQRVFEFRRNTSDRMQYRLSEYQIHVKSLDYSYDVITKWEDYGSIDQLECHLDRCVHHIFKYITSTGGFGREHSLRITLETPWGEIVAVWHETYLAEKD